MLKKNVIVASLLSLSMLLGGCGGGDKAPEQKAAGKKVFRYGTVAYSTSNENAGLNPHFSYQGWTTLRYGVGETLFRFNDRMQPEPWLAEKYEQIDEKTVKIYLKDKVTFSNGHKLTGAAVKACLEDLIKNHKRAAAALQLETITADGQTVTLKTKEKSPALINALCDPYGCIIDMEPGTSDNLKISGTGPFIATSLTPTEVHLKKNSNYWGGEVKLDEVIVRSIPDGDTLTLALQNKELDAAQGLPYASLKLFQENKDFSISSAATSRVFQAAMNYETPALQDDKVRQAVSMAIDKNKFTSVLLRGNGYPAVGPFPTSMGYGPDKLKEAGYNPAKAKELLAQAGYRDTDGDGYVDKDGKNLELRWLTYTTRQELPLLAEAAQSYLKEAGIKVNVNATDNYNDFLKKGEWDIFAMAFVTAPTGDPEYYFNTHVAPGSAYNRGHYNNPAVTALLDELHHEFNPQKRRELALKLSQQVLDDHAIFYASHLKMNLVMQKNVSGFAAHPSDYYEINASVDKK